VPRSNYTTYGGGGWGGGGGYGASTAAGSALQGMSQVISAAGQYNLSTSAAAVNWTQADRNQLENDQLATNTYFEMRATNRAARAAEAGPKPTTEQLMRIAHQGVPKPLNPGEEDPVSGNLRWPSALQEPLFSDDRGELNRLFSKRASFGGLPYADQARVREVVEGMYAGLKTQITMIPPQDYVACRTFLRSLVYSATKADL
jgi:hypothetical protein